MRHNLRAWAWVLVAVLAAAGCSKEKLEPEQVYFRVYDDLNSDRSYYPVDFLELPDGGFYILGATTVDTTRTWLSTHLMRLDPLGQLMWQSTLDKPYMNPVARLMQAGERTVFFCLDDLTLGTHVLEVDDAGQTARLVASMPDRIYPLAVSQSPDGGYVLLNYDRITRESRISKYTASLDRAWDTSYGVIENAEDRLVDHLTRTGPKLPFFTGSVPSGAYVYANGLYNYSLSTLFVSASGQQASVYYGFRYDGGLNAALALNDNTFALMRFHYADQFLLPAQPMQFAGIANTRDLGGAKSAEVASDSENHIVRATIDGREMLVYAFSTNTNQVGLYFYDPASGEFLGKKLFGAVNPVRITAVRPTADGGLALLLETRIFGRFKRIALWKLPKGDLVL